MWKKLKDRMTGSKRTDRLNAELYGLLLQDIARGTVMIFESPGKGRHRVLTRLQFYLERACDLLMQVDIAQPLRFDKLIKEFVSADKDTRQPARFKLAQDVDDIADHFGKRPPPVEGDLTVALGSKSPRFIAGFRCDSNSSSNMSENTATMIR